MSILYIRQTFRVRWRHLISKTINSKVNTIKQGAGLSPLLFAECIDGLLKIIYKLLVLIVISVVVISGASVHNVLIC